MLADNKTIIKVQRKKIPTHSRINSVEGTYLMDSVYLPEN